MKKLHAIFLFTFFNLCIIGTHTYAQNLMDDLVHIQKVLEDPQSFYAKIKVDIDYVEKTNDKDLFNSIVTVIKIGQGCYFYENDMVSMLINDKWVVGVMHYQKQIVYGRNNSKQIEKAKKSLKKNIQTDPKILGNANFISLENNIKHYRVVNPGSGLKHTDIYINSSTQFIHSICNEYADPTKLGIVKTVTQFLEFDDKFKFNTEDFSEKKFLIIEDDKVRAVEKYKNYNIVYSDSELLKIF